MYVGTGEDWGREKERETKTKISKYYCARYVSEEALWDWILQAQRPHMMPHRAKMNHSARSFPKSSTHIIMSKIDGFVFGHCVLWWYAALGHRNIKLTVISGRLVKCDLRLRNLMLNDSQFFAWWNRRTRMHMFWLSTQCTTKDILVLRMFGAHPVADLYERKIKTRKPKGLAWGHMGSLGHWPDKNPCL